MQIPPGSAKASRRAATLTPSPKMSCSSTITSPRLIPTRNSIRLSGGVPSLRSVIPPLHLDSAADGIHYAQKLRQEAVPGVLYDPPPVLTDFWIDQFPKVALKPFVGPLLIRPHQARVAGYVSSKHRREPTFDASWPYGLHGASLRGAILHQPRYARIKQKGALEGAPSVKLGGGSGFAAGETHGGGAGSVVGLDVDKADHAFLDL